MHVRAKLFCTCGEQDYFAGAQNYLVARMWDSKIQVLSTCIFYALVKVVITWKIRAQNVQLGLYISWPTTLYDMLHKQFEGSLPASAPGSSSYFPDQKQCHLVTILFLPTFVPDSNIAHPSFHQYLPQTFPLKKSTMARVYTTY